jgi:hypothetical protein
MTVRAEEAEILGSIVAPVAVYVVNLQCDLLATPRAA